MKYIEEWVPGRAVGRRADAADPRGRARTRRAAGVDSHVGHEGRVRHVYAAHHAVPQGSYAVKLVAGRETALLLEVATRCQDGATQAVLLRWGRAQRVRVRSPWAWMCTRRGRRCA
jgi:hypothetical protein